VGGVGRTGRAVAAGVWFDPWAIAGFAPAMKFNAAPSKMASWIILVVLILSFHGPKKSRSAFRRPKKPFPTIPQTTGKNFDGSSISSPGRPMPEKPFRDNLDGGTSRRTNLFALQPLTKPKLWLSRSN
jgi:hypothetical protein